MSNNNSKSFVARGSRKNGAMGRRESQEKAFIRQEELQSNTPVEGDDDEGGRGETCQSKSRQKRFSAGEKRLPLRRGLARSTVVKGQ